MIYIYIYMCKRMYIYITIICIYIVFPAVGPVSPMSGSSRFRRHSIFLYLSVYIYIHIYIYTCVCVCAQEWGKPTKEVVKNPAAYYLPK